MTILRSHDNWTRTNIGSVAEGMCGGIYDNIKHKDYDYLYTNREIKLCTPHTNYISNPSLLHDNENYKASCFVEEDDNFPGYVKLSLAEVKANNINWDFLLGQIDNGQGSASAPDLLVSRGAVDNNELPEKLNIIDRKIIKDLNELHDKTINLNETFLYSVNDNHTEETGRSLPHSREQRRTRRRTAYLDEFVE
jgi:hypothetical protein